MKQKNFFLNPLTGEAISGEDLKKYKEQNGGTLKSALENKSLNDGLAAEKAAAERAANRAANQANQAAVKEAAMKARDSGFKAGTSAGFKQGVNSVGITGGIRNAYRNAGAVGKMGMIGAAAGGTYLLGKGLGLWGNNKD